MFQWDIQHCAEILVRKVAIFESLQHTQFFLLRWVLMEECLQIVFKLNYRIQFGGGFLGEITSVTDISKRLARQIIMKLKLQN